MADTLLIIEDEQLLAKELARHFRSAGWEVVLAATLSEAETLLVAKNLGPLVVLSDLSLPDGKALDLLDAVRGAKVGASGEWVFLTAYGSIPDSVRALRLGAYDFLEKPCPPDRLDLVVAGAARSARAQQRIADQTEVHNQRYSPEAFLGASPTAEAAREMMRRLASVPFSGLVLGGETGTGKGLAARILHYSGVRGHGPLVEVNCAALPDELLESELFGHEAGAFTSARGRHRGLLEQAAGGTIVLDEVTELDLALQSKLLKAIEDRRVRRLGGEREIQIDVQVIAASNRNLDAAVAEGAFRLDLYHRLSVFRLDLPPLRDRLDDLYQLVPQFIAELNLAAGRQVREVSSEAWANLRAYHWPGNVRELRNAIERCVLLSTDEHFADQWLQLPHSGTAEQPVRVDTVGGTSVVTLPLDGSLSLDTIEKRIIEEALVRLDGNVSAAARALGTTRQTLRYRIQKHGIELDSLRLT
jgi:two-component system response regulator AtoC